jgi:GT2 family glycosyltransferase
MKLYIVVVLYKMLSSDSPTVLSLSNSLRSLKNLDTDVCLLIWDNTPGGQYTGQLPEGALYKAATHNPGLVEAYNYALERAIEGNYEWLLTLDQDTELPEIFLKTLAMLLDTLEDSHEVAAIVPHILGDGRALSPFRFVAGALPFVLRKGCDEMPLHPVFALNSAATFRVSSLAELNGYDPMFPLDISDLDLFRRIHRAGKRVFVATALAVNHDFSLLRKHARMSVGRYRSQLVEECAFWDLYMGPLARLERLVRLMGRVIKDLGKPQEAAYRAVTIKEIVRRLTVSRHIRMADWHTMAFARAAANASPQTLVTAHEL